MFFLCRVYRMNQQWITLNTKLSKQVIPTVTSKSYVQEGGVTVKKQTETVTHVRRVDTNKAFTHVQDAVQWVLNKQVLSYTDL